MQANALVWDTSSTLLELMHMATSTFQAKHSATQEEPATKTVRHQECSLVDIT